MAKIPKISGVKMRLRIREPANLITREPNCPSIVQLKARNVAERNETVTGGISGSVSLDWPSEEALKISVHISNLVNESECIGNDIAKTIHRPPQKHTSELSRCELLSR
jgi:hypothetical protein